MARKKATRKPEPIVEPPIVAPTQAEPFVEPPEIQVQERMPETQPQRYQDLPLEPQSSPKPQLSRIAIGMVAAIVVLTVFAAAYYFQWFGTGLSARSQTIEQLQSEIASLIIVPKNETPTVATINDADSLRNSQAFYRDAQNGDVLLMYSQSQRAILYRPSQRILVNVGPIYFDEQSRATTTE